MRVSFSNLTAARAAVGVFEAYGYSARQIGKDVVTNCPPLLAVPAIQKEVGLSEIDHLDLIGLETSSDSDPGPRVRAGHPSVPDASLAMAGH